MKQFFSLLRASCVIASGLILPAISLKAAPVVTASGCPNFKTYTQGAWGANPAGANPAAFLSANFASAFPSGITIGSSNKIVLTSASAINDFLPQGSTARVLNAGTLTNPASGSYNNVLAGQLLAAMLNVGFDSYFPSFASSTTNLRDLVIASGPFFNKSVSEVIYAANQVIGGSSSAYSPAILNTVLTSINASYDNGTMAGNFLVCPIMITSATSDVSCKYGNNGSITISGVSGGAGFGYTYAWSNGATTASVSGLTAGVYSVVVTDAANFSKTFSFTITEPAAIVAATSAAPILCNGGTTVATVSATGGVSPYTGTGTYVVYAGSYTYTVTDAKGCTSTASITVTQPAALVATVSAAPILCNGGTTVATVAATGGVSPYSGTGANTVSAGSYTYTVTDANGCTSTTSITVTQPAALVASVSAGSIMCYGATTVATVSATGGVSPYTGTGTNTISAGTHSYTVTDANGCTSTTGVTVTQPSALAATISATSILCHGGNATITVGASGGTTPYTGTGYYTVTAGAYSYTVTDNNGCTAATTSVSVSEPASIAITGAQTDDNSCNGGACTGTASVTVSGGTSGYSYSWSAGTGSSSSVNSLCYGTVPSVTVTDANGCASTYTFSEVSCTASCAPLKTFTQGGWGATPSGGNPGAYLCSHFAAAFPSGLTIGSTRTLHLSTASDITSFLPSGGTPAVLSTNYTDPGCTYNNTFAGQLVAATLNVGFDSYYSSFATPSNNLAGMYLNFSPFVGVSVSTLLTEANNLIGGSTSSYTVAQLNTALTYLNENYDNGTVDNGNLVCTGASSRNPNENQLSSTGISDKSTLVIYPNPTQQIINVDLSVSKNVASMIAVYDVTGRLVFSKIYDLTAGKNTVQIDRNVSGISTPGLYLVEVSTDSQILKQTVLVQ